MGKFSEQDVDTIFALGDKDQSGGIDYQEFISMMMPSSQNILMAVSQQFKTITDIKEGFKRVDTNGDGAISRREISMAEFIRLMSPAASSAMNRLRNCFRDIA